MLRTVDMTWSEIKIEWLNPWVNDLTNPDLDPANITEAYGKGVNPEICFIAPEANVAEIYIWENIGDVAPDNIFIQPWRSITMDYNLFVKAMNIFYVTGNAGDVLLIICR